MPYTLCAPPYAMRKPVMTSSKSRSAPCSRADLAQALEEAGPGGTTPMFAATGSTATSAISLAALGEHGSHRVEVVVRHGERVLRGALGHAGRAGDAERREPAAAALREQRVRVPVVAALELQRPRRGR